MRIIIALLIFSLLIIVHELGHFLLAKRGGIRVNEFSLGMGPRLLSKQLGETRYSLKLFPFGGSCMMEGEDGLYEEETLKETGDSREDRREESQRKLPSYSFGAKSVWVRISVVAAGPVFNFILAFLLALFIIGSIGYDEPRVQGVAEGFPAQEAGIQPGDKIIKMNHTRIHVYREVSMYVKTHQQETVNVVYERDGERYSVTLEPKQAEDGKYYLGFKGGGVQVRGGILKTLEYSLYEVKYWISLTIQSLGMLIQGQVGADEVSGPVGIVNAIGESYETSRQDGFFYVLLSMAYMSLLLTANLGVMNLLPIPALDGGRLVFLFLEAIRGKAVDPEKEGMVHFAGLMVLMAVMVLVLFNDVRQIFF
ncbi:MAG: RIP metalloprotease RseP [Lachnospiraceae bacterium]|nr:RIP metalloprotease RseP [Lachnospiraceae bacterium]